MVRPVFVPFLRNLVVATTRRRISYCLAPCESRNFTPCQTTVLYAKTFLGTHQLFLLRFIAGGNSKDNGNSLKESSKQASQTKSIGKETIISVIPKRKSQRKKLDVTQAYTERNFITPLRAMNEYLLKPIDLEGLRKIQRRSPYEETPPIIVYLRTDIEAKALEKWKNSEALKRELRKKREEECAHKDNIFNMKKELKDSRKAEREYQELKRREKILRGSGRVVVAAVTINATNFILKLMAWLYTGSHSMFAEVIHSFADTCNQLILAFGIRKSIQQATQEHPYGYHTMRYVASLISGVGIFCFGTGLSIYHGIMGLLHPEQMEPLFWAYMALSISLMTEGGTLMIAFNAIKKGAFQEGMSVKEYVLRSQDPSVNVVLLEDLAAVLGVGIAATCMGLSSYMGSPVYDAVGSILLGGLLGTVASFIIYTNSAALVGRSIPPERLQMINKELENDVMIRAIHDVKATDMGNSVVRYKAEVDFDGRELTTSYLDSQDLDKMLQEVQNIKTFEEMEAFMLKHGENIVDLLGAHVDRIETTMKKRHPEVRHVDLEVL
ncbi:zinc transporter 9-like isoform X2 [Limulus polyphemus]|uniref:Proton-coupled zinc antiporter SLC30A9, mitochondrial n=1 Tax=Limulus polyphemus TaxID=6850 RepID=A0ABM1BT81_LIMPO|nr:zinc transporter 9-like isoform X2 [Limulus polyphemus]